MQKTKDKFTSFFGKMKDSSFSKTNYQSTKEGNSLKLNHLQNNFELAGPSTTKMIHLFIVLLIEHKQFIDQLHLSYKLDYWILQSTYILMSENKIETNENLKFTNENFCSALLLAWEYLEDDYHCVNKIINYFSKILPCKNDCFIEKRKYILKNKTIFFVNGLNCHVDLKNEIIKEFKFRVLTYEPNYIPRNNQEGLCLSATLL
ncbi:Uncharacterized protein QTN25_009785 [Entamoeba marina]